MKTLYENWSTNVPCEISNADNIYDEAGLQHNKMLTKIEKEGNSNMNLDEVFQVVNNVLEKEYFDVIMPDYSSKRFAMPILDFENQEDYEHYIDSLNLPLEAKANILRLNEILFRYDGSNICEIINEIKLFEVNLITISNPELNSIVLIGSSIGRYSLAYWNSRVDKNANIQAKKRGWWKKFFVAVADVIGGTGGAVAGSATVVGGIAGAVIGGCSASAGFAKVWDIYSE